MKRFLSILLLASALEANVSTDADRTDVSITIYNQNLALVTEQRTVTVGKGIDELRFLGTTDAIDPTTAVLRSLNAPNDFRIHEQSYNRNLVTQNRLLQNYIGKELELLQWNEFHDRTEITKAKLLSTEGDGIYEIDGEIYLGLPATRVLPEMPEDLVTEPSLSWLVHCPAKRKHNLQLSYLTAGFNWQADYLLVLGGSGRAVLSGWATIHNHTNASFRGADLTLVAGAPNRVHGGGQPVVKMRSMAADSASEFAEETLFAYHAYQLDRKASIRARESKQLALLPSSDIRVEKEYRVQGGQPYFTGHLRGEGTKLPVSVILHFENEERNALGVPLPAGVVRLYQPDSRGTLQFIGEDRIGHTAKEEEVSLQAGTAFDLVAERKQLDYKRVSNKLHESEWEVTLRNHSDERVTIALLERLYGNWTVVRSSHDYEKSDANTIRFDIQIAAGEEVKVRYEARVGL